MLSKPWLPMCRNVRPCPGDRGPVGRLAFMLLARSAVQPGVSGQAEASTAFFASVHPRTILTHSSGW